MNEWTNLPDKFWVYLDQGEKFKGRVGGTARRELKELVSKEDCERAFLDEDQHKINIRLREIIAPYLQKEERAADCAIWIIKNWGGIRTGGDWEEYWLKDLGNFSEQSVERFVSRWGPERIASWSKLLAFAKPDKYAIYDARVAVSINCALRKVGDGRRFVAPLTQIKDINEWVAKLSKKYSKRAYLDYLDLLNEGVRKKHSKDILGLEMQLFANQEKLLAMDPEYPTRRL